MNPKARDREHDFTLVLTELPSLTPEVESALFDAGCDDATIAVRSGRMFLTFSRAAPTMKDAILSAIRDIKKSRIGAEVLRIDDCNLVTQSDIARRMDRSRQLVNQYISGARGPGSFPPPVCDIADGAPLWLWCEVAGWLFDNNMLREDVLRNAEEVEAINAVLEFRRQRKHRSGLLSEIMRSMFRRKPSESLLSALD